MVSSQEMLSDELYVASIAEVYSVVSECSWLVHGKAIINIIIFLLNYFYIWHMLDINENISIPIVTQPVTVSVLTKNISISNALRAFSLCSIICNVCKGYKCKWIRREWRTTAIAVSPLILEWWD